MNYHPFLPILILLVLAAVVAGVILFLSSKVGPKRRSLVKDSPYECGLDPVGTARERVDVRFSLIAMLFIVFDIEVVFFFPWAVLYKQFIAEGMGLFFFAEMGLFILILAVGLAFVWRKGILDWK